MALLNKAAGQGHAYAMDALGNIHHDRKERVLAVEWYTKGAEAGLPRAMFNLGALLDKVGLTPQVDPGLTTLGFSA